MRVPLWTPFVSLIRREAESSCNEESSRLWYPWNIPPESVLPEFTSLHPYTDPNIRYIPNSVWFSAAIGTLARNFVSQFRCRVAYQLRIRTYRTVHEISRNLSRQMGFSRPSREEACADATIGAPTGSLLFSRNGMIYSEGGRRTLGSSQSATCNQVPATTVSNRRPRCRRWRILIKDVFWHAVI